MSTTEIKIGSWLHYTFDMDQMLKKMEFENSKNFEKFENSKKLVIDTCDPDLTESPTN